jgi:putative acetyltransferase
MVPGHGLPIAPPPCSIRGSLGGHREKRRRDHKAVETEMNQIEDPTTIRLATINEASVIALVLREAFAEYEPLYTAGAFAATTPTGEQIEKRWNEGPVWVASHAEQVVGTVAAAPRDAALYIRSMALRPLPRGNGLGQMLLEQVESFAQRHSFRRMFLSTTPFLYRAIRLYERFGFVRIADGPHALHGTPLFIMEKAIQLNVA